MGNNPVMGSDPTGGADTICTDINDPNKSATIKANTPKNVYMKGTWIKSKTFRPDPSQTTYADNPNYSNPALNILVNELSNIGTSLDALVPQGGENYQAGAYNFYDNEGSGGIPNGGHITVGNYYGAMNITTLTYLLGGGTDPEWRGVMLDLTSTSKEIYDKHKNSVVLQPKIDSSFMYIDPAKGDTLDAPSAMKRFHGSLGPTINIFDWQYKSK